MLIEFSICNYRSFKEQVTFSMVAAELAATDKKLDENNVFKVDDDLKLLKSAAIYGANASGKSNLATALNFMTWFMINSSKHLLIPLPLFQLDIQPTNQQSHINQLCSSQNVGRTPLLARRVRKPNDVGNQCQYQPHLDESD